MIPPTKSPTTMRTPTMMRKMKSAHPPSPGRLTRLPSAPTRLPARLLSTAALELRLNGRSQRPRRRDVGRGEAPAAASAAGGRRRRRQARPSVIAASSWHVAWCAARAATAQYGGGARRVGTRRRHSARRRREGRALGGTCGEARRVRRVAPPPVAVADPIENAIPDLDAPAGRRSARIESCRPPRRCRLERRPRRDDRACTCRSSTRGARRRARRSARSIRR